MPGMPGFDPLDPTANLIRSSGNTVKFIDKDGRLATTRLSGLGAADVAIGENARFAEAVGDVSNMGVYGFSEDRDNERLRTDAIVYDETHSDASQALRMIFQNNEGRVIDYYVPAPQAVIFADDGVTLLSLPDDPLTDTVEEAKVRELILASQNSINTSFAPVNSYVFQRGYRTTLKQKLGRGASAKPQVVDPTPGTGSAN